MAGQPMRIQSPNLTRNCSAFPLAALRGGAIKGSRDGFPAAVYASRAQVAVVDRLAVQVDRNRSLTSLRARINRPAASGQRPAASGQRPAASGQRPAASGQRHDVCQATGRSARTVVRSAGRFPAQTRPAYRAFPHPQRSLSRTCAACSVRSRCSPPRLQRHGATTPRMRCRRDKAPRCGVAADRVGDRGSECPEPAFLRSCHLPRLRGWSRPDAPRGHEPQEVRVGGPASGDVQGHHPQLRNLAPPYVRGYAALRPANGTPALRIGGRR